MATVLAPSGVPPRRPVLERPTAMRLAATEYRRMAELLAGLRPEEWAVPTECPGWDVRTMAGHLLGAAEMAASVLQGLRQNRAASAEGGGIDALTALQVREHASLSPREVAERYAALAPGAARGRRRAPGLLRRLAIPELMDVGGRPERWTFGFLLDVVLTRDTWMHRVDICRALGRSVELTAEDDGLLVADVVAEWAQRHGRPVRLRLTGPAGGSWAFGGNDAPELELDAVEFCRALSGRGDAPGLLAQQVPF